MDIESFWTEGYAGQTLNSGLYLNNEIVMPNGQMRICRIFLPLKIVEPIILIEDQLKKKFKLLHTLHILSTKTLRIENYILRLAICGWWWLLKVKKSHKHFFLFNHILEAREEIIFFFVAFWKNERQEKLLLRFSDLDI